jgi:molybdopterin converting factor small subunit
MRVTVKFFGEMRSLVGKKEEEINLPLGATLADFQRLLNIKYHLNTTHFFLNLNGKGIAGDEFESCLVSDGDVIMIIPPISGG